MSASHDPVDWAARFAQALAAEEQRPARKVRYARLRRAIAEWIAGWSDAIRAGLLDDVQVWLDFAEPMNLHAGDNHACTVFISTRKQRKRGEPITRLVHLPRAYNKLPADDCELIVASALSEALWQVLDESGARERVGAFFRAQFAARKRGIDER